MGHWNICTWLVATGMVQPFWKVVLGHSHRKSISSDPVIPLLGHRPREIIQQTERENKPNYLQEIDPATSIGNKNEKEPTPPSTDVLKGLRGRSLPQTRDIASVSKLISSSELFSAWELCLHLEKGPKGSGKTDDGVKLNVISHSERTSDFFPISSNSNGSPNKNRKEDNFS